MKFCERYKNIYNNYKDQPIKCINIERARLKRDTSFFNVFPLFIALFGFLISILYNIKTNSICNFLTIVIIVMLILITLAAYRAANNEFKLSVLDDILKNKAVLRKNRVIHR